MQSVTKEKTSKLIENVLTNHIENYIKVIPYDWEELSGSRYDSFRNETSECLLDILSSTEEKDSEEIACGKNAPTRGGIFNTDLDSLNELVRRLDLVTEKKNYYGVFEDCENVQLVVKLCSFVSARAVALMYYKEDEDDDGSDEEDLYSRTSKGSPLTEAKCIEKILKWFRRIGREDTDRAEELCGYVQLFVSPDVDDEFIVFKDKFLMSLFGVDLYDIGAEGECADGEVVGDDDDYDDDDGDYDDDDDVESEFDD